MEQLLGEFDQVRRDFGALRRTLESARGEARSADGYVRVIVGSRGDLRDLQLDPRAYRRFSPTELAAEILELSGKAVSDVQRQLERVMAPFLPKGVSYAEATSGQVDLASWFPRQPLTADAFGEWWDGIRKNAPAESGKEDHG